MSLGSLGSPVTPGGPDPALLAEVRSLLAQVDRVPTAADVTVAVRQAGGVRGSRSLAELDVAVRAELLGAGPLQALLDDPEVTDVLVNGPRDVWVERAGHLAPTALDLGDVARVRALAVRLAAAGGQRLDDACPTVDAQLPDGTRLHAVLPPVSGSCALISLRVVRRDAFTLGDLVANGTVAPAIAPVLGALVHGRANLLVTGATGSGKTTVLSTLLSLVPRDERIVCIEETAELDPDHPHVVHLLARRANVDGAGEVGLGELVRQALRMRPDRIVLGECRGGEVRDVLTALNTGHEGGCATLHANGPAEVPARLEALGSLAGMSRESVAAQAASAFDAVLHLRRDGPRRYLAAVAVVGRGSLGALVVETAIEVVAGGLLVRGPGWPRLAARIGAT